MRGGLDRVYRLPEGYPGCQVEGGGYRRELALVIHREGCRRSLETSKRAERYHGSGGRTHIDVPECLGPLPELRRNLHHHVILVQKRVGDRHLTLAEGVVQ